MKRKEKLIKEVYSNVKGKFSRFASSLQFCIVPVLVSVVLISLIVSPVAVMAQMQGYGQALRGKATMGGDENVFKEKRFLQKGKLVPQELSEEARELAGFSQSVVSYQIHVVGEVINPGTYRVSPSTRLDEALKRAGGINPLGSTKKIQVKRAGGKEIVVDITDFKRNGNLASNPYLLDNDVVFVPFAKKIVRFEGAIHASGVVELGDERTLADGLKMVGGTTVDVLIDEPMTVVRYDNKTGERKLIKVQNDSVSIDNFEIENGDLIFVPNVVTKGKTFDFNTEDIPGGRTFYPSSRDAVFVIGAISAPGAYPFDPFSTAEEYVLYAGPYKSSSILGMKVMTVDGRKISGRKACNGHKLSPGDVIVVPEKILTTEKTLMWYNTFASTIITGFTLKQLLK